MGGSLVDRAREAVASRTGAMEGSTSSVPSWEEEPIGDVPRSKEFADLQLPQIAKGRGLVHLPIDQVLPAADNDRLEIGDVSDLAASIASTGLLNPITVTQTGDDKYTVIAGHRRLAALEHLGWNEVPVLILDLNETDISVARLIENIQREDLNPIEEAKAIGKLSNVHGLSQRAVADKIGRSQAHVSKRLALLELPATALDRLHTGELSLTDAAELLKLREHQDHLLDVWKEFEEYLIEKAEWEETPEAERRYAPYVVDIPRSVALALEDIKTEQRLAETKAKLERDGVQVVDRPSHNGKVKELGQEAHGKFPLKAKDHASEPCHAAWIDDAGRAKPVCTDPSRHKARGASPLKVKLASTKKATSPEQKERAEMVKAMKPHQERRHDFIKETILSKAADANDALALHYLMVQVEAARDDYYFDEFPTPADVLKWLGTSKDVRWEKAAAEVGDLATQGPGQRARLFLAETVHRIEGALDAWIRDVTWRPTVPKPLPEIRPYFVFLVRHGYTISDEENALLAEAAE